MTVVLEKGIFELLKNLANEKVYAMVAPQNETGPFLIFQRIDSNRDYHLKGPSGMAQAFIQIDAYAKGYYAAKELGAQAESILAGYRGMVYYGDDSPQDSVRIGGITVQNDVDILDQTEEPMLFRSSIVVLVTYEQ